MIYSSQKTRLSQTRFRLKKLMTKGHRTTMEQKQEFQPILMSGEQHSLSSTDVQQEYMPEALNDASLREMYALDGWLSFKVKNELVKQIYSSLKDDESLIDIASVKNIISNELSVEIKNNRDKAEQLSDIIPQAATKENSENGNSDYSSKDISNLQMRIAIHNQVATYIESAEAAGDDNMYDLTELYIQKVQLDAQSEVLTILKQQKAEFEKRNTENEEKIIELQAVIVTLDAEIKHTYDQLSERDIMILDGELVEHLTVEARDLAR